MDLTALFNLALDAAGSRHTVSIHSERSREAEVCTRWYPTVRDHVLHAAFWPSAKAIKRLAVVIERDVDVVWAVGDPDPGWRYAYSAPADMLRPRFMADFSRFEMTSAANNSSLLISQTEQALLVYTKRQAEIDAWDPGLRMSIIYALAAHITLPLNGKVDRVELNIQLANSFIAEARANMANVNESTYESNPEWFQARGFGGTSVPTRYFYPYGPMIAVTEGVSVA